MCQKCRKSSNNSVCCLDSGDVGVALYLANIFTLPNSINDEDRGRLKYVVFLLAYPGGMVYLKLKLMWLSVIRSGSSNSNSNNNRSNSNDSS